MRNRPSLTEFVGLPRLVLAVLLVVEGVVLIVAFIPSFWWGTAASALHAVLIDVLVIADVRREMRRDPTDTHMLALTPDAAGEPQQ